jgi:hypothetical protein
MDAAYSPHPAIRVKAVAFASVLCTTPHRRVLGDTARSTPFTSAADIAVCSNFQLVAAHLYFS